MSRRWLYSRFITDVGLDDEIDHQFSNADHADWAGAELVTSSGSRVYVSDLYWSSATNGWGPVERDQNVGGKAVGDGQVITLNGKRYARGLGAHAKSEIRYRLDKKYARFRSDVGIDDVVQNKGSVVFQVWGDGAKLYNSGLMIGSSPTKTVDVDVSQVKELRLIVDTPLPGALVFQVWGDGTKLYESPLMNGGSKTETVDVSIEKVKDLRLVVLDGDNDLFCDHADWADARLVSSDSVSEKRRGVLSLTILDDTTGTPTAARVEALDASGKGYVADDALLISDEGPLGQQTLLSRRSRFRYTGTDQFYSTGQSKLSLPAGLYHLRVWKGIEYAVQRRSISIEAGRPTALTVRMSRWIDMPARGWYSGDDHLHLSRSNPKMDPLISKWMQAEDIHFANLLQMGDITQFREYPQYAHGPGGRYREGNYFLAAGQENPRTHVLGHVIFLGARSPISFPETYVLYRHFWDEARRRAR